MAADCAVELRASNVAFVSLWPGAVRTEFFTHMVKTQTADGFFNAGRAENEPKLDCSIIYSIALSTEYEGKAVVALATDLNIMKKSGKILMTADLGYEYGFKDIDGREPMNIRQLSTLMQMNPKTRWLANIVPNFIYLPKWMLALSGNKFYFPAENAVCKKDTKMDSSMSGKVCIVTGATRGIGKGIALQLGQAGATVYITGRTLTSSKDDPVGGSLTETAEEIEKRGGKCIPVQCDHTKDSEIEELFSRVSKEQDGCLDLLVNNAYAAVKAIAENIGVPFWEQPISMWDTVNNVGLRNNYLCSVHAAKLMTVRKSGLIVNISSIGGLRYLFNVPYGVGKEAMDRMAADCAVELRKMNVSFVSLWPGLVKTEHMEHMIETDVIKKFDKAVPEDMPKVDTGEMVENAETTEFAGKAIVALATDPKIIKKSGRILTTADLGKEYGFKDIDGKDPQNIRQVKSILKLSPSTRRLASVIPGFVYIPKWMLAAAGNKF